jgi:uncharacterized lipoprotein
MTSSKWFFAALAVATIAGCGDAGPENPSEPGRRSTAAARPASTAPHGPEKPIAKGRPKTVYRTTDDFGLPLVIVLEAPEAPPEIRGPSPPIRDLPPNQKSVGTQGSGPK